MRQAEAKGVRFFSGKNLGRACAIVLLLIPLTTAALDSGSEPVAFNTQTHKVHKLSCIWAERCTKNCITLKRAEAYRRGGVPCKVCGG